MSWKEWWNTRTRPKYVLRSYLEAGSSRMPRGSTIINSSVGINTRLMEGAVKIFRIFGIFFWFAPIRKLGLGLVPRRGNSCPIWLLTHSFSFPIAFQKVDETFAMAPTTTSSRTITLDDLTPQNTGLLKKLNTVLFPVPYSEKFYKESVNVGELAKLGQSAQTRFPIDCECDTELVLTNSILQRRLCWSCKMSI